MSYSSASRPSINTLNASVARMQSQGIRAKRQRKEDHQAMIELVLSEVHISQWSVLPPSPREIKGKAAIMGIWVSDY